MLDIKKFPEIKDMPHDIPGALKLYHEHAARARAKIEGGFQPVLKYSDTLDETTSVLGVVSDLLSGVFNRAAFWVTRPIHTKALTRINDNRLHLLVDWNVRLNLIHALSFDADRQGIDYNDLACVKSDDFNQILEYAEIRAQLVSVAHPEPEQPQP